MGKEIDKITWIPPKPIGRVSVEDPEEKYGEPVITGNHNLTLEESISLSREFNGQQSNEDVLEQFAQSLTDEQWNDIRQILQQMPVAGEDTYIETDIIPATLVYLGKLQERKHYSRKMQGNYDEIMADALAEIEKLEKEDFLRWLDRAKKHDIKPITEEDRKLYGDGLLAEDTETAYEWLAERCRPFEYALEEWGQDTQELKRLIEDHVKEWFPKEKRRYRKAEDAQGIIEKADGRTPIITNVDYNGALNFGETGKAYLQEYDPAQLPEEEKDRFDIAEAENTNFVFENGKLFLSVMQDGIRRRIMPAQLQNLKTGKHIDQIDTGLLKVAFGFIVHAKSEDPGIQRVKIYIPDFYHEMTGKRNVPATSYLHDEHGNIILDENGNKKTRKPGFKDRLIDTIQREYQNVGGMIYEPGGREPSIYPPLLFEGYNEAENTIELSSPYIDKLYSALMESRSKYISQNEAGRKTQLYKPFFSYLIDSTIYAKNTKLDKIAVRNVEIIVDFIERAGVGAHTPSISIKTIIDRNALLKQQLAESKNRTRDLQRAFERTYDYLRRYTHLQDKYKDIQLPEHPKDTPGVRDYKTKVLVFRHKGLNKDGQ